MKRTTIGAVFAAAALFLAGCGSTGGTATAGTTLPAATAATSAEPPAPSPEQTTAEAPTEQTTAEAPTDETSAEAPTDESSVDAPTTTLGGDATGIDAQTTAWFDTFCTALAPVKDLTGLQSQIDPSDPKKTLQVVAGAMTKMGSAFTDAATELKDAPPPTFDGGAEFAGKIVTSFGDLGPKFTQIGEEFAKADPTDPSSLTALSGLQSDLQEAVKPLQELQNIKVSDAVSQGIAAIPSCAKLAG
jgi:hypothetical protein